MYHKAKVGQIWIHGGERFRIISISFDTAEVVNGDDSHRFTWMLIDGKIPLPPSWYVEGYSKIIEGIPMDPSLHILEAGHLQDHMRRRKHA